MKKAKTVLAFVLALVMLFSVSLTAFADGADAQYKTTKEFLSTLDSLDGFEYEVGDITTTNMGKYERVDIQYSGDLSEYVSYVAAYFNEDCDEVTFILFNLINFDEADLADILVDINDLNARTTGMKLYVDTSDNSVTAELYQLLPENSSAEVSVTALYFALGFTDKVFEALQDYAI